MLLMEIINYVQTCLIKDERYYDFFTCNSCRVQAKDICEFES